MFIGDSPSNRGRGRRIFRRADRGVPYGEMMDVLERLRKGGYLKVALVALEAVGDKPADGKVKP